jgi:hypothetical protein
MGVCLIGLLATTLAGIKNATTNSSSSQPSLPPQKLDQCSHSTGMSGIIRSTPPPTQLVEEAEAVSQTPTQLAGSRICYNSCCSSNSSGIVSVASLPHTQPEDSSCSSLSKDVNWSPESRMLLEAMEKLNQMMAGCPSPTSLLPIS